MMTAFKSLGQLPRGVHFFLLAYCVESTAAVQHLVSLTQFQLVTALVFGLGAVVRWMKLLIEMDGVLWK